MRMLTRAEILVDRNTKLKIKKYATPVWGGGVYLKQLSGADRDMIDKVGIESGDQYKDLRARYIVYSVCDEKGVLLFKHEDIPMITKMDGGITTALFKEITKISGIGAEEVDKAVKN